MCNLFVQPAVLMAFLHGAFLPSLMREAKAPDPKGSQLAILRKVAEGRNGGICKAGAVKEMFLFH